MLKGQHFIETLRAVDVMDDYYPGQHLVRSNPRTLIHLASSDLPSRDIAKPYSNI